MPGTINLEMKLKINTKMDLVLFIFLSRWPYRLLIILLAIASAVCGLFVPFLQKSFVENLLITNMMGAAGLAFISMVCLQLTNYIGTKEALICQSTLANYLYKHILSLKSSSSKKTTGEKVALYTTDISSATMWLEQTLPYVLTTFFPLILTPIFLRNLYDLPYSFSFLTLVIMITFNYFLAKRQSVFFYRFKILAGERMGLVNEWIQNIKSLKTLNWIPGFEKKIITKRIEETHNRILMVTNGQIMNSFSASITFWLNLLVLVFIYFTFSDQVNKADLLVLLWVMGIFLSRPLRQLPWLLTMLFDALTSVNRLFDFYKLYNTENIIQTTTQKDPQSVLEVENLNLTLSGQYLLKNINLKIQRNEIVALIGPVGGGKSLLLQSLLNEASITANHFFSEPASYLPQDPFIMSATIKDNISLNYESTETDESCLAALKKSEFDILRDRLPEGLQTIIGERGLNLSGGQKQRLNLSRIFFNPQKLILLDDPFSAVDIGTEHKLIQSVLDLKKSGHSFLVTTQRYSFLNYCDRVIFIEDGEIKYNGSFNTFKEDKKLSEFLV
jgi:ATP-binding cassette subfamily B multidrug efflux pump